MTNKELEQIYNEAYKAVYWTAMSLLKNEADAEDIVQDTFVTLIESYDSINDKSKVTSWLKKTAANKCLDRLKLAKTDNMDEEFFDSVEAVPEDFLPDSIVESEAARKVVVDIINNSLSDDIRRTLILFYFDDMSIKEIAVALGVPEGTVSRRLNFARNKIKKEVEKYEKDNDTKLYAMAIPFLSKLFIKEAEQVVFKPLPAALANLSASAQAAKAGTQVAKVAIKKGTDVMKTKILIGSIASVVAIGATAGVITVVANNNPKPTETVITEETKERAADVPIRELKQYSYDNVANVTYLKATPEDTTGLSEGPKEYHYGMGTIYVKYNGSDSFEPGVLIITNVRCVVSGRAMPDDDKHIWMIDDDWALGCAIEQFCKDKGIAQKDLGLITKTNIQSITDEYYSSIRYVSATTWNIHSKDGDVYTFGKDKVEP